MDQAPNCDPVNEMGGNPSGGSYAAERIGLLVKGIVGLQSDVLKDRDPEPLHQLRVRFRYLGTLLRQFAPALLLPERVSENQLAKTGKCLGLVRDLDVLLGQLEHHYLPLLADQDRALLKPLLKSLRRQRKLAFTEMAEELRSRRYLKLLAQLQGWQRKPVFSAMGEEPAQDWLAEWKAPVLAGLLSHAGWRATDADRDAPDLHDLRKRIKQARYGLANLQALVPESLDPWLGSFKSQQETLGMLNDLQVLTKALDNQLSEELETELPDLHQQMQAQKRELWQQWQGQARWILAEPGRKALYGLLWPGLGSVGATLTPTMVVSKLPNQG
jgi:CHAD domain-containing protein